MTQSKRKQYIKSLEDKKYSVEDAMKFIQASPKVKFNESIDVAVNLGVDPTKSDQNVRGQQPCLLVQESPARLLFL